MNLQMTKQRRGLRTTWGLAIVAAAGIGVTVAQGSTTQQLAPPAPWWESDRPLASSVQHDQADAFAVFARGRTATDAMPANAREQVGNSTRSGRNVALSRSISTPTGTGWAVPGNGIVCLVVPDPIDGYGITCTETRHARTHGIAVILISPDDPETAKLTLLTPRGSHITATMTDGGTHRLHADQDGVVSAALEAAKSVTVETSSGTARLDMPAPPPAAANGNCPIGQVIEAGADC